MLKNAQLIIALLNDAEYCSCAFFQKIIQMAEMGFLRREYEKQNENKCENIYIMV